MTSAQSPALGYGEMAAVGSTESGHSRQLSGRLGVGSITFMVIAAAAPLTVIGGALPVSMLIGNGAGMPTMYAVTCVILLLFTVGFTAMARHIPRPGAFFTYIGFGLGRPAALSAAHLALLTYTAVQVGVYCYLGEALSGSITRLTGFTLPWWVFALATVAVVAVLGYRHIELSSKVLAVLLVAEILIVLVLGITILSQGGAEGINLDSFRPEFILSGSPALGLMFAVAAFLGFEATAIFRGEARSPDRTIPRATYLAVGIIGVFYTFSAWTLVLGIGVSKIADEVSQDPASLIIRLTSRYLGPVGGGIVDVLLVTSMFACVLSFHNVVTRYQHSMSNAAVFPNVVSRIHTAHGSPHVSSVIQTATAGLLIGIFGALQLDPVLQVFTWLGVCACCRS